MPVFSTKKKVVIAGLQMERITTYWVVDIAIPRAAANVAKSFYLLTSRQKGNSLSFTVVLVKGLMV